MLTVRYYKMDTKKNAGFSVVFGEWPQGSMKNRGYSPKRLIFSRQCTSDEQEFIKKCSRFYSLFYKNSDLLILDEREIMAPLELQKLMDILCRG